MTDALPGKVSGLLPSFNETPKCSAYTKSLNVDPAGTAIAADAIVLIEVPLPWPKPVFQHPNLMGLESMIETTMGSTRVLAALPNKNTSGIGITIFFRNGGDTERLEFRVPDSTSSLELLASFKETHPSKSEKYKENKSESDKVLLLCTQGSHDICCGSEGTRLANLLDEMHTDIEIFRVSHTGGHRFAPTAMTLPSGRMWAGLDASTLIAIFDQNCQPELVANKCRGWWGASRGPCQVAEREIFKRFGWALDARQREIEIEEINQGWVVTVKANEKKWKVQIVKGREVPTIACRSEGGLPFTISNEYEVKSFQSL